MVSFKVDVVIPILRLLAVFLPLSFVEKEASSVSNVSSFPSAS